MTHLGERTAINNRLRAISKKMPEFDVYDCIDCYEAGIHYSYDWQECIDSKVKRGKLVANPNGKYSLPVS